MHTQSAASTPAKRHACVGLTYYTAWMRTHGNAPVCVGFSQVKDEVGTAEPLEHATPAEPQRHDKDFKVVLETPLQTQSNDTSQSKVDVQQGDAAAVPEPIHTRLMSKATQNWTQIQAALRNEGPVVFKPIPKDYEEMSKRVVEQVEKNRKKVVAGAVRLGNYAYASTVKPLAAILGLTPRPKS